MSRKARFTGRRTQGEARAELVEQWAQGQRRGDRDKSRFVFAYTNDDVNELNAALRAVRKQRGELGEDHALETAHGRVAFAAGDRIQFTGTDKKAGIDNGARRHDRGDRRHPSAVRLDGRDGKTINFDAASFDQFRHGYAGTIYAARVDARPDLSLSFRALALGRELCRVDPAPREGRAVRCAQHGEGRQGAGAANGAQRRDARRLDVLRSNKPSGRCGP